METEQQVEILQQRESALKMLRRRFFEFEPRKFEGLYRNSGGYACAIVASVGQVDWAVYIGGCSPESEEAGLKQVASFGAKMSEKDALHFFGDLPLMYRA